MTVQELVDFFKAEHNLQVTSWGLKFEPFVYPPRRTYNASNLPPLDLARNQAFMAIQKNGDIPRSDKQIAFNAWQQAQKSGEYPPAKKSTLDMTVLDLLAERGGVDISGRRLLEVGGINFSDAKGVPAEVPAVYLRL